MKTTILAAITVAVLATTSMASAGPIDNVGTAGIVSENYSKTVIDMTKAKACKGGQREQAYTDLRADALATSNDLDLKIGEVMVLAHQESNRILSTALKDASCSTDTASLIHQSDFAHVRVPADSYSRLKAKISGLKIRDKAVEAIVLRTAARNCDFDDYQKYVAMMERVGREIEINKLAFDDDFLTSSAWSFDDRKSTFRNNFGDISECEAGFQLVAKYSDNYERDAD